jgi:hypothetical protein
VPFKAPWLFAFKHFIKHGKQRTISSNSKE